jgi:hypothetical protein
MKLSQLIHLLGAIGETEGDLEVNIACRKPTPEEEKKHPGLAEQEYLMSIPEHLIVETYEDHKELSIRDWPY